MACLQTDSQPGSSISGGMGEYEVWSKTNLHVRTSRVSTDNKMSAVADRGDESIPFL